jgi:predicted 2-oxoglutarate/Fe(II)-dependent dioxygenase YbiX
MDYIELGPAIYQYEFPANLAKDLVHVFETDERVFWGKSAVGHGNDANQEVRTSQEFPFEHQMPVSASMVKEVFVKAVDHYCEQQKISITQDEGLNLLKYSGPSKYDFHADADWTMYRVLSGLIYLNPQDYEGGETYFKNFDLSVHPESPAIVLFPSNYAYIHAAMPVTEGTKYILVTWGNDMPPGFNHRILAHIAGSVGR